MAEFRFNDLFAGTPDLRKIEELVRCCERRKARATEKLTAAEAETAAAQAAYERAVAARADWIAASPDPQLLML
ncbi:hypothetical protein [Novosphingobium sp. KA1]|uniref:hypothetical protein n=1 Tax=Novosphingobium sp. (strain KA1) TaxID=164608 RepID=UPI001A8D6B44|nr:hypothetical protein [Novosphingobium sp. KA1]QSR15647.1 hypothetical protein CA833_00235 [Novosphingobium sp. KA1]